MNKSPLFSKHILGLCISLVIVNSHAAERAPVTTASLLQQAGQLPAGFAEHFFDVPLAVRIELNGQLLGEGMITLTSDERVRLLEMTPQNGTLSNHSKWVDILSQERRLGDCKNDCPDKLLALHYSIENSLLSIVTADAEHNSGEAKYYSLPEESGLGLIMSNRLNLVNDGETGTSGNYWLDASGSLGKWSVFSGLQASKSSENYESDSLLYSLSHLYSQRESEGKFLRLGYFLPETLSMGLQPLTIGGRPDTTLGVMFGTSDSLAVRNDSPSSTPIYVTANRPGIVEIYRNQQLINSQPVQPGLQTIDTRTLPGGIYPVEVRLVEDGEVSWKSEETIYKPENWRDTENRWRYNVYAGQSTDLVSNWQDRERSGLNAGALLNYLLHPRVVTGVSAQHVEGEMQYGTTADWRVTDKISLYGNYSWAQNRGQAIDMQSVYNYGGGNLVLSHNQSWMDSTTRYGSYKGETSTSAVNLNHRITPKNSLTSRVSRSQGNSNGTGVDVGWQHNGTLFSSNAQWRVSVFDRPGSYSSNSGRNRGVDLNLSFNLGSKKDRVSARLGSRTARDGGRDNNAALSWQREFEDSVITQVNSTVTTDRYGTGLDVGADFSSSLARGDLYAQQSSYSKSLGGGLNMESTVAFGGNKLAVSGEPHYGGAGLIIDVDSDVKGVRLRADEHGGNSTLLRPGRNFIPVEPYKTGHIQFDLETEQHAVNIKPATASYQLNRGGVEYRKIEVMKTITVMGRVLNHEGQPLRGGHVINHASRSVTENNGFFAVEMNTSAPTLDIQHQGQSLCALTVDLNAHQQENNVLMMGDIQCKKAS